LSKYDKQSEVMAMKQKMQNRAGEHEFGKHSELPDFFNNYAQIWMKPQSQEYALPAQEAKQSLEKIKESLVFAYLASNLNCKNLPLKAFMDSFEKKILLACLRLTGGNQKNAAAVMSIKPTVLFEKMRKHGISRQQLRLPGAWSAAQRDLGD
jgi:DNA-binding NtrC family response regulator